MDRRETPATAARTVTLATERSVKYGVCLTRPGGARAENDHRIWHQPASSLLLSSGGMLRSRAGGQKMRFRSGGAWREAAVVFCGACAGSTLQMDHDVDAAIWSWAYSRAAEGNVPR